MSGQAQGSGRRYGGPLASSGPPWPWVPGANPPSLSPPALHPHPAPPFRITCRPRRAQAAQVPGHPVAHRLQRHAGAGPDPVHPDVTRPAPPPQPAALAHMPAFDCPPALGFTCVTRHRTESSTGGRAGLPMRQGGHRLQAMVGEHAPTPRRARSPVALPTPRSAPRSSMLVRFAVHTLSHTCNCRVRNTVKAGCQTAGSVEVLEGWWGWGGDGQGRGRGAAKPSNLQVQQECCT